MQRYKNFVHMEEMKQLLEAGKKEEALQVAESINISKIKTMTDLSIMAEVFFQNQNYPKAKKYFDKIYEKLKTRRILAQMVNLSIKLKNEEDAERYLEEFERIAPKDFYRHIFRFDIDKMLGKPYATLIDDLERLRKEEYIDSWSYELAKLYHKIKNKEKCIKECSRIILWFGNGVYVERAMALKAYYEGELEVDGGFLKLDSNVKGAIHDTLVAAQERLTAVELEYTDQEVDHLSAVGDKLEGNEPIEEDELIEENVIEELIEEDVIVELIEEDVIVEKGEFTLMELDGSETAEFEVISSNELEDRSLEAVKVEWNALEADEIKLEQEIDETEEDEPEDYKLELDEPEEYELELDEPEDYELEMDEPEDYESELTESDNTAREAAELEHKEITEAEFKVVDEMNYKELVIKMPSIKGAKFGSKRKTAGQLSSDTKVFAKMKQQETKETMKLVLNENIFEVEKALAESIRMNMQEDAKDAKKKKSQKQKTPKQMAKEKLDAEEQKLRLEREAVEREVEERLYQMIREEEGVLGEEEVSPVKQKEIRRDSLFYCLMQENESTIEELFGFYTRIDKVRNQLIEVMEKLLNPNATNCNLVVVGEAMCGKTTLAKNIFRVLYKANLLQSVQIARISAEKFSEIDLVARKEKMRRTILIIEHAEQLTGFAAEQLVLLSEELGKEISFVLEGEEKSLQLLFQNNQRLAEIFLHQIEIPILSAEQMYELSLFYIIEKGYEMEEGVDVYVRKQVSELMDTTKNDILCSLFAFLDSTMKRTDDRNSKQLLQRSLSGGVAGENLLLIKCEDFKQ